MQSEHFSLSFGFELRLYVFSSSKYKEIKFSIFSKSNPSFIFPISDKIGIPDSRSLLLPPSSTFASRTYGRHYDRGYSNYRYSDSSYYNTGGYRDYNNNYRDYGYNENIY